MTTALRPCWAAAVWSRRQRWTGCGATWRRAPTPRSPSRRCMRSTGRSKVTDQPVAQAWGWDLGMGRKGWMAIMSWDSSCIGLEYPFQTGLKTRNVLRRTFRVHPRPLSVWKVAEWSPPGEHGTNSGWTQREIRARPSSTNTERPPEDVPCLPQTAASMKGLGTHTVCKPEPEIQEWTY